MVILIPAIVAAAEAAAAAIAAATPYIMAAAAGIAGGAAISEVIDDVSAKDKAEEKAPAAVQECPKKKECENSCTPPVGTRAYQIDSGHNHRPCHVPQLHVHIYVMQQVPAYSTSKKYAPCTCYWEKTEPAICLNPGETFSPPAGMIPYPG